MHEPLRTRPHPVDKRGGQEQGEGKLPVPAWAGLIEIDGTAAGGAGHRAENGRRWGGSEGASPDPRTEAAGGLLGGLLLVLGLLRRRRPVLGAFGPLQSPKPLGFLLLLLRHLLLPLFESEIPLGQRRCSWCGAARRGDSACGSHYSRLDFRARCFRRSAAAFFSFRARLGLR